MAISCDPAALVKAAKCFTCVPRQARRWVRAYLLCQGTNSSISAQNLGAQVASAWAARVVSNGGAMPSQTSISAVAVFANTLNNAGVWAKLLDVNIFAPDSLTACLTPILITDGSGFWVNHNFVAGDLTVNGLIGDGATKYLDTQIIPNRFFGNPPTVFPGLTYYVAASRPDGSFCEMSWIQNNWSLYCGFGGTCFYDCFLTGAGRISVANPTWAGFLSGSRLNLATSSIYKASSTVPFAQVANTNANNTNNNVVGQTIFMFANQAAGALQWSPRRLSFGAYHFGLSQADTQTLYNAVQALRTSLGGGFV